MSTIEPDQRNDPLLRSLVSQCEPILATHGYQLDKRQHSAEQGWVRFSRPARDPNGRLGTLTVLVAHGRSEAALLIDAYFEDAALGVQTPRRKLVHRYAPDAALSQVVGEVMARLDDWRSGTRPSGQD